MVSASGNNSNAYPFNTTFILEVYNPASGTYPTSADRIDWIGIDPELTKLTLSTAAPGGMDTLDVGTLEANPLAPDQIRRRPLLSRGIKLRNNAHVRLRAGRHIIFEGRLVRREEPGEDVRAFTAKGYGFTATGDHVIYSKMGNGYTSRAMLIAALSISAPFLRQSPATYLQDPGNPHSLSEFNQQNAAQVVDRITKEGGSGNVQYDFFVWERGYYQLIPRLAPAMADYVIPYDAETINWIEDVTKLYGMVQSAYTDPSTSAALILQIAANDPTFVDRTGLSRDTIIQAGKISGSSATSLAFSQLGIDKLPTFSVSIKRSNGQGLILSNGSEQPPWLVRAGQWVRVADYLPLLIVRTTYDASQGTLTIELGNPFYSIAQLVQDLRNTSGHIINVTNVTTGAPS